MGHLYVLLVSQSVRTPNSGVCVCGLARLIKVTLPPTRAGTPTRSQAQAPVCKPNPHPDLTPTLDLTRWCLSLLWPPIIYLSDLTRPHVTTEPGDVGRELFGHGLQPRPARPQRIRNTVSGSTSGVMGLGLWLRSGDRLEVFWWVSVPTPSGPLKLSTHWMWLTGR